MVQNILNVFSEIDYKTFWSTVLASSAFTAFINGFFSWKNNKDRISADIKAKARIEWIQDVKKNISNYVESIDGYLRARRSFLNDLSNKNLANEFLESISNMEKANNYISFCFPNNYDEKNIPNPSRNKFFKMRHPVLFKNRKIIYSYQIDYSRNIGDEERLIREIIFNPTSNYQKNFYIQTFIVQHFNDILVDDYLLVERMADKPIPDDFETHNNKMNSDLSYYINSLRDVLSVYLKIEWDIAKKGK